MSHHFLPVNPCCTNVVNPCGCSSTTSNTGPCNTTLTASSTIAYDGLALSCTTIEPSDTLNVVLQKIDEVICNLLGQINILTTEVNNLNSQITIINGDIININNRLDVCCNVTTTSTSTSTSTSTTTSTTANPCPNCIPGLPITIGTQEWTNCNLDVTTYRNGDAIPEVQDPVAWAALTTGAWCYYANDTANGPVYGKLYNWYAVNDIRGLAPVGYHIPTDAEFTTLTTFLGGESISGGKLKEEGLCHWTSPNTGATNETNFTGLPGGSRTEDGTFVAIEDFGGWWSSTEFSSFVWARYLDYNTNAVDRVSTSKSVGFSVRLIQD